MPTCGIKRPPTFKGVIPSKRVVLGMSVTLKSRGVKNRDDLQSRVEFAEIIPFIQTLPTCR